MHLNYDHLKHFTSARRALHVQHCWIVWNIRCKTKRRLLNCWLLLFWPLPSVQGWQYWCTERQKSVGKCGKNESRTKGMHREREGAMERRRKGLKKLLGEKWWSQKGEAGDREKVGGRVESALGRMEMFCVRSFHWNKILQSPANTMATALRQVMLACSWGSVDAPSH